MSEKRSVSTDALETLGTIIEEGAGRDAIHLAVEPCIAAEILMPGDHIGIKDGFATKYAPKTLGIVDPFISGSVQKGDRFWLIVYPRTITSLRHVWSHPDFKEQYEIREDNLLKEAEAWITDFAEKIGSTYEELMEGAKEYAGGGDYMHMGDNEEYSNYGDEMPSFWQYYEIITGESPKDGDKGSFFSCSC